MLKREFKQHMRRLSRFLLAITLAYFMVSAFIMQSISSNIRLLYSSTTWIELLPLSYNLFYGVTVCFFVLIFFYYILRTLFIPKGTRDFSPVEMAKRNYIFNTIRDVYHLYGFQQIETQIGRAHV